MFTKKKIEAYKSRGVIILNCERGRVVKAVSSSLTGQCPRGCKSHRSHFMNFIEFIL